MEIDLLMSVGGSLVGIGSVYGLIRNDLANLHQKNTEQRDTNRAIFEKMDYIDRRISTHVENHHTVT